MKTMISMRGVVAAGACLTLASLPASAAVLTYMPYDGGSVGQDLVDTTALGSGAIGLDGTDFTALHDPLNQEYVAGLGGIGNAMQMTYGRQRMIIDRTTSDYVASGVVDGAGLVGADGSTIYGSLLIRNPNGAPVGFTGLEFAIGDPNSNRKITLGEAEGAGLDWVVIGSGAAGAAATPTNLALPAAGDWTRQIIFRIDFGAADVDTFTLMNPDGTDIVTSGSSNLTFSTLHLANYTSSYGPVYDEIILGSEFVDVVPEPSVSLLGALGILGLMRRRR